VNLLRDDASFERASRFLAGYFEGSKADFQGELDLRGTTPFQAKVWSVLRQIPHGETRSYAWVATRLGEADSARAVGQVVGQNPIPIIVPCHRVVHEDGSLGGFSGGLHWKKRLLALERGQSGFF
jgi:methylated-DNA-[protein]-cysteine S-methyltransferase